MERLAEAAEAMNHHPDIMICYDRVTLTLTTHDAGTVTTKDIRLAEVAEYLAAQVLED